MKDLVEERNKLYYKASQLKDLKFEKYISQELSLKLLKEEREIYKRYLFYKNYIKIGGKLNGKEICTKKR